MAAVTENKACFQRRFHKKGVQLVFLARSQYIIGPAVAMCCAVEHFARDKSLAGETDAIRAASPVQPGRFLFLFFLAPIFRDFSRLRSFLKFESSWRKIEAFEWCRHIGFELFGVTDSGFSNLSNYSDFYFMSSIFEIFWDLLDVQIFSIFRDLREGRRFCSLKV